MCRWTSPTSCSVGGSRCGTASVSGTGGRCTATPSASWAPTGRARCSSRPGAARSASSAPRWWRCARCPPRLPRRASLAAITRLEGLCADAWPAAVERSLGAWRLRAAGGYTGRANAALAIGDPGMPVAAALDVVRAFSARPRASRRASRCPTGRRGTGRWPGRAGCSTPTTPPGAEVAVLVAALDGAPDRERRGGRAAVRRTGGGSGRRPTAANAGASAPWSTPAGPLRIGVRAGQRTRTGPQSDTCGRPWCDDHLHLSLLAVAPTARRSGLATRAARRHGGLGSRARRALGGAAGRPCTTPPRAPSTSGSASSSTTATATWCRPADGRDPPPRRTPGPARGSGRTARHPFRRRRAAATAR